MITWRAPLLVAFVAAALIQGCVDIPGGRGLSDESYPYGREPYYGGGPYSGPDAEIEREWEERQRLRFTCEQVDDRIRFDRDKIATIDPSRHHKALQWYRDDLANAERDADRCRGYGGGDYDHRREDAERDRERREQAREQREQQREQCEKIAERMRFDRDKIDTTDPARHPKARQWYIDDLRNAERDMQSCRRP